MANAKGYGKKDIKLAVFDIDGTIFRSSLTVELVNALIKAGIFPKRAKDEMEEDYLAWINRKGHYDTYMKQLVRILFKYIRGCKKKDIDEIVRKVLAWQKDRVYRYTRDLIKSLRAKGYFLLAISGSPSYMVSRFTKSMGFHASFGIVYEVKRGRFTGEISDMTPIEDKKKVFQEFIEDQKLNVDFTHSIAVGDTDGDIPMLEMVGNPIAFNPNRELAEFAKCEGWVIVVERKDVIYEVKDFEFKS